jgi:hypothetical protein
VVASNTHSLVLIQPSFLLSKRSFIASEVTTPVLVNKGLGSKLMTAASIAAAPFTGGASLAANAARMAVVQGVKGAAKLATKEGAAGLAGQAAKKLATDKGKETAMDMAMESMRSQQQQNQQKQMQQQQEQQRLMEAGKAQASTNGGQL